jgi:subtilisin family serine protease
MVIEPFPQEVVLGPPGYEETLLIRSKELLVAFAPGTTDDRINAVLGANGLTEREGDQGLVWRVGSHSNRWVNVTGTQDDRETARTLLTNFPECRLASPVYVPASDPHPSIASAPIPGTLLVKLHDPDDTSAIDDILTLPLQLDAEWSALMKTVLRFRVIGLSDDGFELRDKVEGMGGVAAAQLDWLRLDPLEYAPNSMLYQDQWNLEAIGMPTAWNTTRGDPTIMIAVIDTGFDLLHPALAESFTPPDLRVWVTEDAAGLVVFDPDPQVPMNPTLAPQVGTCILTSTDFRWHGTAVAGIIAGSHSHNTAGIAPECQLMPVRVWPMNVSTVAAGLKWAADHGARVANFSITCPNLDIGLFDALFYAFAVKDMVICAAAGNGVPGIQSPSVQFPAAYQPQVIAVGACDGSGLPKKATQTGEQWFSVEGADISVLAPGLGIPTTDARLNAGYNQGGQNACLHWYGETYAGAALGPSDEYILPFTGTSAAVAHVSAVAGLILACNPQLTNVDVRNRLEQTCDKVGGAGEYTVPTPNGWRSPTMGYGRVNAAKAVM